MPSALTIACAAETARPPAMRVTLADAEGQYLPPEQAVFSLSQPRGFGWAYAQDRILYRVAPGRYFFTVSAGPAWNVTVGKVDVANGVDANVQINWQRQCDPHALGLAAGDMHLHTGRGVKDFDFATSFLAEEIDLGGVQYWGKYAEANHVEDPPSPGLSRIGNTWITSDEEIEMHSPWGPWEDTTVVGLTEPLPDLRTDGQYRMNASFYREARKRGCRMIVYQAPIWAQFPVDIALGLVDSVNLCDNYFSIVRADRGPWEYTYFAPDDPLQHDPRGIALWVFEHYYRILNAGFRIPASGGSASPGGGGGGPIGMNRFYIHTHAPDDYDACLAAWRRGNTFATNGPLLLATVDDQLPGSESIDTSAGRNRLSMRVISNRPVERLQWIADGQVVARCDLSASMPQDETWEQEVDLRPYRWVAARCFGQSERTFFPEGGAVSPPLLTAHTSPFCLTGPDKPHTIRTDAVRSLVGHLDWMQAVVDGKAEAPFASKHSAAVTLDTSAKAEIESILNEARHRIEKQADPDSEN